MIKKLIISMFLCASTVFSFLGIIQLNEPADETIVVSKKDGDKDKGGKVETEDGVMYLSFVKFN